MVCLIAVAFATQPGTADGDEIIIPSGSEWRYSYQESATETGVLSLRANGTLRCQCLGLTTLYTSGEGPEVVLFYTTIIANIDGEVYSSGWPGWLGAWHDVSGRLETAHLEYYDPYTGMPVRTVINQKLDVRKYGDNGPVIYYEERNDTLYTSVTVKPHRLLLDNELGNLSPGTNWTVVYAGSASVEGFENNEYFSRSYDLHTHTNHSFVGNERVEVPAGNFTCNKVRSYYEDATVEEWYSQVVHRSVKTVISSQGNLIVYPLVDYGLQVETISGDPDDRDLILLSAVAIAVSVAVGGTVAFYLWKRKRQPAQEPEPERTEEERVG